MAAFGTRGTTLAPRRTCFWFKRKCSDGLLVAILITLKDTWCISRVSKARLHTTPTPSALRGQSMCATDEGVLKGEKWCRKCIWGNLLPRWKQTFGSVEKISSGDFVSVWTERVDHLANKFSTTVGGVSTTSPTPKSHARPATVARANLRPPRPRALQLRALAVFARPAHPNPLHAIAPPNGDNRIATVRIKRDHAGATAARRATTGSVRLQRQAAAVAR